MKAGRNKTTSLRMVAQVHIVLLLLLGSAGPCFAAGDDATATEQAVQTINESSQAVADGFSTLQERVSESRLVNRTRDQNVAFVLMGILVGSFAGMFSRIRCSGMGMIGRLGLGLGGAFIGGMVVRIGQIDFGWGMVSMSYEELLFSLLGAVALVVLSRFIQLQMKKKKSKS